MLVSLWYTKTSSPFLLTAHVSGAKKDKVRESEGRNGRCLNFGVFYPSSLSSASTLSVSLFFFMYFSERWQDRASRQAPVKFNMILKNGEIKAEWPCSLTYVKFIQTCLALLLNLIVHGFLNDVQIKRTLSKTE